MLDLGTRIREERLKKGWSKQRLADMVGCRWDSVYKWERGYCVPTTLNLKKIEEVLGLQCGELLR